MNSDLHRLKAPCGQGAFNGLNMRCVRVLCICLFVAFNPGAKILAAETSVPDLKKRTYVLESFLQSDVLPFHEPAFSDRADINGKSFDAVRLFAYPFFSKELQPSFRTWEGKTFDWDGKEVCWRQVDSSYRIAFSPKDSSQMAWALSCFYVRVPDYMKASLEFSFLPAFALYMDGIKVMSRETEADSVAEPQKCVLKMEPGFHVFVLQALYGSATNTENGFSLRFVSDSVPMQVGSRISEYYGMSHYLDGVTVSSPQLSASGKFARLTFRRSRPEAKKYETFHRIYRIDELSAGGSARMIQELDGVSDLSFASGKDVYAYMRTQGKFKRIYAGNIGEPAELVYETQEKLGGFAWDPQGRYMILQYYTEGEKPANGLKRLNDPMDQWPYYRMRVSLAKLDLVSGVQRPLTYGYLSTSLMDISSDGRYLLFSTSEDCDSMRQYTLQKVYRLDLQESETELLYQTYFSGNAVFSPDGKKLLVTGPEHTFSDPYAQGVARACEDCFIPNDFDMDAFIFDISTGNVEPISEGFGPSFQRAEWDRSGEYVYFYADDHDCVNLFSYHLKSGKYARIPAETDVVNGFALASDGLLYTGEGIDSPYAAYWIKGSAAKNEFASAKALKNTYCLASPNAEWFERIELGQHHDWCFVSDRGDSIEAVYYLPPDFDAEKKYPCIVYYYSGTTPTPRALSLRYPKSLWAAQGYVVLVLQPSGAVGYDREFSARHVNNWGITVADEIISGVRQFCRRHAFVDSSRLGCIGASYGGFMTQLLVTRTDLFAAAVSHAGISSISSYWGEGYWGYLYGSAANAFSFPWNRKDIFVDQSPLFNADKVHTPLLLLHGTSDVNVPIGESYQMYKALRLLGRTVEMVTIEGEDHGIVDYAKRLDWEKTILAWFEKYLKGKSLWWETLYPERKM